MERRQFLKTVLTSSVVMPLTATLAEGSTSDEEALYLIADSPQVMLPRLLAGVGLAGRTFAFAQSHPLADKVGPALEGLGWKAAGARRRADAALSFASLDSACAPSFTFIRGGRVIDLRRSRLVSLWEDLSRSDDQASVLTVVNLASKHPAPARGGRAAVYLDGKKKETIALGRDAGRTYESAGGFVTVNVLGGRIRVSDSSCRHKVCLSSPAVSDAGGRIICAPNRFYLEVDGRGRVDTIIG